MAELPRQSYSVELCPERQRVAPAAREVRASCDDRLSETGPAVLRIHTTGLVPFLPRSARRRSALRAGRAVALPPARQVGGSGVVPSTAASPVSRGASVVSTRTPLLAPAGVAVGGTCRKDRDSGESSTSLRIRKEQANVVAWSRQRARRRDRNWEANWLARWALTEALDERDAVLRGAA